MIEEAFQQGCAARKVGLSNGTGVHPCGIEGFSAESRAGASLAELATWVPNNQIGVTTVGEVRAAGGEVTPTSGRSPNHATVNRRQMAQSLESVFAGVAWP